MVIAAVGTVLAAGYLLWMLQKAAFGNAREEFADSPDVKDATKHEFWAWVPMLVLIVVLGFYPRLIHEASDPAVGESLVVNVGDNVYDCLDSEDGRDCFDDLRAESAEKSNGNG